MPLLEKTVEMRGSQILNMQSYQSVLCQRRFMAVTTAMAWLSVIPLIIALATCSWCIIDFMNTDGFKVNVQLGTWGEWRTRTNRTNTLTDWIPHFPSPPESVLRLADASLRHFHRAQAALGAISICLLLATNCLALYTFSEHRYMFKRLCGIMYVISGVCIFGTVEIVSKSVDEWRTEILSKSSGDFDAFDFEAKKKYGYSAYLALGVAATCILAAIAFAYGSHKQKGDHAATVDLEIEDRPVHYGRD